MTWYFNNRIIKELPSGCAGFVYLITNEVTGRQYIGKKIAQFKKTKRKTIKLKNGKKKKKKIKSLIESDWAIYYGSNKELLEDINKLGKEKFRREVLQFCNSKNELSYYELKYQVMNDVLFDEARWYNKWISVKVRSIKAKKTV